MEYCEYETDGKNRREIRDSKYTRSSALRRPSEKDRYHLISLMWNLRNKTNEEKRDKTKQKRLLNTENKQVVARGGRWLGEIDKGVKITLTLLSTEKCVELWNFFKITTFLALKLLN